MLSESYNIFINGLKSANYGSDLLIIRKIFVFFMISMLVNRANAIYL